MKTSPAFKSPALTSQGFTLIEILVVVVIVSIMAGMAVLAIGGGGERALKSEAKRLQQVLMFAVDEATYRNRQFGLATHESSYQLFHFDPQAHQWLPAEEPAFDTYQLPDIIRLRIEIEGEPLSLAPADAKQKPSDALIATQATPQLLILSSGEITPFVLQLQLDNGSRALLTSDGLSAIELEFFYEA